jgi:N-carbamoyl-L-amino-acid hydrolase
MRIDKRRLEQSIEELGRIGQTPRGGLTRLALSDEDKRGRDWMVGRMREAGLSITVDQMGNIFGQRAGDPGLPPVMMGSHVDSVPTGGRYDGQLGVLCGLEVIRSLDDAKVRTRHPVTLAIFTNEEGARFQPAMIASGVMAGKIALEDAYNARDKDGIRLVDELERIGYLGSEPCVARPFRAYLELHIEQGPFLEEEGLSVGVVEGIVAIAWSRLAIHGVQDHAGPTPMRIRHDALVAAAEVVSGVRRIAREMGGELVTTVGNLVVAPNIVNAIPGRVTLSIDMRDPRDARGRAVRARALLARAVHVLRSRRRRRRRARRPSGRRAPPADPLRRRPRCSVHGRDRPRRHGIRALARRPQPLRGGVHADRRHRAGRHDPAPGGARPGRTRVSA